MRLYNFKNMTIGFLLFLIVYSVYLFYFLLDRNKKITTKITFWIYTFVLIHQLYKLGLFDWMSYKIF